MRSADSKLAVLMSISLLASAGIWPVWAVNLVETIEADRMSANGNELDRLSGEAQKIASHAVPDPEGATIVLREAWPDDPAVELSVRGDRLSEGVGKRILAAVARYIRIRLEGHSPGFATYLVFHGAEAWPERLEKRLWGSDELKKMVAFPWIHEDSHPPVAFPLQHESEGWAVINVVDGELAWAYFFLKGGKAAPTNTLVLRYDAVEFAPAASETIRRVARELRAGRDPSAAHQEGSLWWWWKLKERLHESAGLNWRTPSELNPNAFFD